MATQIGVSRIYTDLAEKDESKQVQCKNCQVKAVPRGITSTMKTAVGEEKHCPNCGHVHGRANH